MSEPTETSRRDVLKTALYVAPAILTFPVLPAAAKSGSERGDYHKKKDDKDYKDYKDYKDDKHDWDDKKWKKGGWKN